MRKRPEKPVGWPRRRAVDSGRSRSRFRPRPR